MENSMKTNLKYCPRKQNNEMLYRIQDIIQRENSNLLLNKRASQETQQHFFSFIGD